MSLVTLFLEFGSSGLYKLEHLFLWQFAECLRLGHFLEVLCNVFMTQHPNVSYLHACVSTLEGTVRDKNWLYFSNYTIGEIRCYSVYSNGQCHRWGEGVGNRDSLSQAASVRGPQTVLVHQSRLASPQGSFRWIVDFDLTCFYGSCLWC